MAKVMPKGIRVRSKGRRRKSMMRPMMKANASREAFCIIN